MKKINLVLLIIIISIVISLVTFIALEQSKIVQVDRYVADVQVTQTGTIGLNADPDGFHFGRVAKGGAASRTLMITDIKEDTIVKIRGKGEISPFLGLPPDFLIETGQNKNTSVAVHIPPDAEVGNYSGEVIVTLMRI
jgi:hypothetical protein